MDIVSKILMVFLILMAIALLIVIFILLYPFKYDLKLSYKDDERLEVRLNYIVFNIKGFVSYKPKLSYELKLWNNVLVDSKKKKKKEEADSIGDTDFINDKSIENITIESKKTIKELFVSSKKLENIKTKELKERSTEQKEREVKEINERVDKFVGIIPKDMIYAIKRVIKEGVYALHVIKPNKCKVSISYGDKDPYITGLISAISAPVYALIGKDMNIKPDFNNDFVSGDIEISGRPILGRLVKPILSLLFDKRFRRVFAK